MSKSNYLEAKLLDHTLRNTAYTPPATVYAALYTSDPGEGNTGTEVTGGSYARQSVSFAAASGGTISSNSTETFSTLPVATITHIGICDASSGGNLLYYAELDSPITTVSGSDIVFASGDITVTED